MRALPILLLLATAPAWAQLGEEQSEFELALERARYGGWPALVAFSEAGLTHADPNAPLWMREDIKAALTRWVHVKVNTPKDRRPAKPIVERFKIKEFPTLVLVSWNGTEWKRYTGRASGDELLALLVKHGKQTRPIHDREIAFRKGLLARARKRHGKGEAAAALRDIKKLMRRKPAYQRAVEAAALKERIAAEGRAAVGKTVSVAGEKAWDKAIKALRRKYTGVDLRGAIAAAKLARAKAKAPVGTGSGSGSGAAPEPADTRWTRARALELEGKWLAARTLLRAIVRAKSPAATQAAARLKQYGTDAKIKAAIARLEKDRRCTSLKKLAENYLRNKMTPKARETLEKLEAEAPHPLADWAARELIALD